MPKTPKEVFSVFSLEHLQYMAERIRDIDYAEKNKKQLVNELAAHCSSLGLTKMLQELKVKQLKELGKLCEWEDDRPTVKSAIAKKLQETMEDQTPKKFLSRLSPDLKREILKALQVDPPASREDYVDVILQTTHEIGMENFFSSFPTTKLKEFVKYCSLKIDSDSLDTILRALVEQESIKAHYEPAPGEVPSKTQPEINKNISVVDLWTHYYKEDLASWCNNEKLTSHGSKKEIIERIRRFFDGNLEDRDKKKERKKKITSSEEDEVEDKEKTSSRSSKKNQPNKNESVRETEHQESKPRKKNKSEEKNQGERK